MARFELIGVRKSFDRTDVLKGVDLSIADGEFISLVGPSGCGKSTLLRIIAGLEQQTAGSVQIGGDIVDGIRPADRNLAMVFQSYALYPHLTVFNNIAVPLRMRRLSTLQRLALVRWLIPGTRETERGIHTDVEKVADLLGMKDLLQRKPAQLSGGQRQRVAVGRAIVREPRAFLLDEPLSNLDAKLRVHMRTEIAQLHRRLGATFIYVTHDQAEAMTMSDRIAVMMDGNIIQIGSPDEVYDDPQDLRVAEFIGSPKINILDGGVVIEDGGLALGTGRIPVTVSDQPGQSVRIGIRPEALRLASADTAPIAGRLAHKENLGAEVLLHVDVAGQSAPVIVRLDHGGARGIGIGERIGLAFAWEDLMLFNASGRRVGALHTPQKEAAYG
ncbi:MAG: glycerol-3-phosphate ABC transporter ATP-binding protein [Hyphomicrobium sp. SCN 65-11]|nr:MAG: glycerol-3-phosphate ABC transporter ATP-binding protein [Hyphomicrobium sp. SCN 65-11]